MTSDTAAAGDTSAVARMGTTLPDGVAISMPRSGSEDAALCKRAKRASAEESASLLLPSAAAAPLLNDGVRLPAGTRGEGRADALGIFSRGGGGGAVPRARPCASAKRAANCVQVRGSLAPVRRDDTRGSYSGQRVTLDDSAASAAAMSSRSAVFSVSGHVEAAQLSHTGRRIARAVSRGDCLATGRTSNSTSPTRRGGGGGGG